MTDITEELTNALAEHAIVIDWNGQASACAGCDWQPDDSLDLTDGEQHAAHLAAAVLAPLVAERERASAEQAWDEGVRRCDQAWREGDAISVFDRNPYRAAALTTAARPVVESPVEADLRAVVERQRDDQWNLLSRRYMDALAKLEDVRAVLKEWDWYAPEDAEEDAEEANDAAILTALRAALDGSGQSGQEDRT